MNFGKKMNSSEFVNSLFSLEGHVGIITGASRGLGMGQAKVLADAGAKIYNFDRGDSSKEEDIPDGKMVDVKIDLTDYEALEKAVLDVVKNEGKIDFLINNAGITYKERAEIFPIDKYRLIERVNLEAVLRLCQLCYPYLKQSEHIGRIVSISSMGAYMGFSGVTPYCMTKSGIVGLTHGLAEEWKHDNILVNSVSPGWFLTKLNEKMFADNPDRKAAAANKPMLDHFGLPTDIGKMMLFLLSNASTYITGHDFSVDGGARVHGF